MSLMLLGQQSAGDKGTAAAQQAKLTAVLKLIKVRGGALLAFFPFFLFPSWHCGAVGCFPTRSPRTGCAFTLLPATPSTLRRRTCGASSGRPWRSTAARCAASSAPSRWGGGGMAWPSCAGRAGLGCPQARWGVWCAHSAAALQAVRVPSRSAVACMGGGGINVGPCPCRPPALPTGRALHLRGVSAALRRAGHVVSAALRLLRRGRRAAQGLLAASRLVCTRSCSAALAGHTLREGRAFRNAQPCQPGWCPPPSCSNVLSTIGQPQGMTQSGAGSAGTPGNSSPGGSLA